MRRSRNRRRVVQKLGLFFFRIVFLLGFGIVAPGVGLRAWHNPGNIGVFAGITLSTDAAAGAGFSSSRRFFLLLFCASTLALALAPGQWIPCSHLALL